MVTELFKYKLKNLVVTGAVLDISVVCVLCMLYMYGGFGGDGWGMI